MAGTKLEVTVVQPLTKPCTNCDGRGAWEALDPRTGEPLYEDGLPCIHECQRCKGTGKELRR